MSRIFAFAILSIIAVCAAFLGWKADKSFFDELWSQIFWLTIGTLATVFILESILQRADRARQIARDAFAFRTFAASILSNLLGMVGHDPNNEELIQAALDGDDHFSAEAMSVSKIVSKRPQRIQPEAYERHYLDVSNHLTDLSRNYIRLFSSDRTEMLNHYREISRLASRWEYIDEFSEHSEEYRQSLDADDEERKRRDNDLRQAEQCAQETIAATAAKIADLAAKNAAGKRNYQ